MRIYNKDAGGILHYTGRILPTQKIGGNTEMSDVMIDLSCTRFHVPLVDQRSPLPYIIVNEVHWYSKVARHSGVETVLKVNLHKTKNSCGSPFCVHTHAQLKKVLKKRNLFANLRTAKV